MPAQTRIRDSVRSISEELRLLASAYLAIQGGNALVDAAASMGQVADAAKGMQARMALVVGEGPKLQAAMKGVQDIALSTGSALDDTAKLFTKIADAGKAMQIGTEEALALTETVSKTIALSGEGADASRAAIQQLIQGLQSGVLRGDEFNSVMEQAPRLSKAMADGLGVTTGELRKLAEAGTLSAETVIRALQGQARTIDTEFSKLPQTIGRALTDLSTQWALFVSQTDEASGASAKAAAVIETLGQNLDLIAAALINSGQAWLGWKAYGIAAEFLGLRTAVAATAAATGVATAATIANTAATAANTTAQVANNAARVGSAAGVLDLAGAAGKLGTALSLLKGFSLAFLLTNLKDIGEWLGKTAFGFTELAKRNQEQERDARANEAASKAMAAQTAELAAKQQRAADAAFGLSKRSKELVADFEEQIKKGDQAAEAIGKLAKAFDLSSPKGLNEAGAALDDLARKGQLSADQVRQAWQRALSGKDLRIFEAEANAAFDGTEQGARRLAAALDAVLIEAVRRTGKDLSELTSGISIGAQTAINDFDTLLARLDDVRAKGLDVGETLAASLDQAAKAATTEAALLELGKRWEALGKNGLLAGERLRKGLDGAKEKLDDLAPGINSVTEAFKTLGMRAPEELKRTAETAKQAFETIRTAGTATPAQITAAFRRYAETVIEANGGVATDTLRIQAAMRGLTIEVDAAGKAIVRAMAGGADETERFGAAAGRATDQVLRLQDAAERRPTNLSGTFGGNVDKRGGITGNIDLRDNSGELTVDQLRAANATEAEIQDYYSRRRLSQQDQAAGLVSRPVSTQAIDHEQIARQQGLTGQAVKAFVAAFSDLLPEEMAALQSKLRTVAVTSTEGYLTEYSGAFERAKQRATEEARRSATRDAQAPAPAPASVHRVEIVVGGKTVPVDTASPDAAQSLIGVLKELKSRAA
ncbi:tape measure protein [Accumulibacter sp.]|uniref:tape measure protein n=1 Tax=Accumulibacter sp. TaxID=2053492 RepID=UPI002629E9F1|nr:tape measure protein [Accumulibacter sp.]